MKSKFLKNKLAVFMVIFLIFIGVMIAYSAEYGPKPTSTTTTLTRVLLMTSKGNITIELFDDMPITTANFLNLTKMGVYDNTIFHRVIAGFMIQGGDPTGTGNGSSSIASIRDEFTNHNRNDVYTLAMAKRGSSNGVVPNSASSQFFINVVNNSAQRSFMDQDYSVFGRVVVGMDVVNAIASVQVDSNSRPLQDVKLLKALIIT